VGVTTSGRVCAWCRGPIRTTARRDAITCSTRCRQARDPARVIGAKPAVFIRWVFDLLGALPGDEFVDVFPGSGGVGRAWAAFCA
jgi:hypothetical protein